MTDFLHATTVVIPIIFVLMYGYFAGKFKAFGTAPAIPIINKLVLNFALPPALFVGTISIKREELSQDLFLFLSLLITLLIAYAIGYVLARYVFKRNVVESSIAGLAVSFAAGPFYGPALLEGIYGIQSVVAVSIIAFVLNVVIVPLATIIIRIALARKNATTTSLPKMLATSIYNAIIHAPYVWAPMVGMILVLLNIHVPDVAQNALTLIGKATAGTAVFVAGLTIAANTLKITPEILLISILKAVVTPIIFYGVATSIGMPITSTLFHEGLLLTALASGPIIVLLATQYQQYQQQAASIMAITTFAMIITLSLIITFVT